MPRESLTYKFDRRIPDFSPRSFGTSLGGWYDANQGITLAGTVGGSDWDCQAGTTSAWTAGGGATLSKQSNRPGGGNTLRVAGAAGYAYQSGVVSSGQFIRVQGTCRSDGVGQPYIMNASLAGQWNGTASTSPQTFDVTFRTNGTSLPILYTASGGYTEWWNLSVSSVSISAWGDQSSNGRHMVQAVGARQSGYALRNGRNALLFEQDAGIDIRYAGNYGGPTGTVFFVGKMDSENDGYSHIALGDGNVGWLAYSTWVGGPQWTIYNGSAQTAAFNQSVARIFEFGFLGASGYYAVDGGAKSTGSIGTNTPTSFGIGSASAFYSFNGWAHEVVVVTRALTDAERTIMNAYLKKKWGTP